MTRQWEVGTMKITVVDRGPALGDRLRERLNLASRLRCDEHKAQVLAVTIRARENGWFDSTWFTCCDRLTQKATLVLKERC